MGGLDDDLLGDVNDGEEDGKGFHFNITQATLDQLTKSGLAKEVVQQGDGTEYELGADGTLDEERKFAMLGKEITNDELREAGIVGGNIGKNRVPQMFMDQSLPVEEAPGYQKSLDVGNTLTDGIIEDEIVDMEITSDDDIISESAAEKGAANIIDVDIAEEEEESDEVIESKDDSPNDNENPVDPIDMLTVARLKEILRAQGLKVGGTKQVLRDRLRNHVNDLLQEE
eukprot:CAMPEP_0183715412 /NCGR_PEP_ID=MMETSP0737-20130205/9640_1 /TAXON_ID=385413 /ORGANISM="Thalassiosira miniscula, Strain CCMP1093" /LENGTH=227 /DNA_ID=CAMNT_0025944503 /DNA_START=8 /DNA_END=691 /DNA_ORIENTATION=-